MIRILRCLYLLQYIGCVQINVTGGGSGSLGSVNFPGAYAGSDPGITIVRGDYMILESLADYLTQDIYYPVPTTYTFPGGSVWPSGA